MKPYLAICHTPYQVLVETLRAFEADGCPDLILSNSVPDAEALAQRLSASGVFGSVCVFDEKGCGSAKQTGFWRTLLLQKLLGLRLVEKQAGFSIPKNQYKTIYIHNDWSILGQYLQDKGLSYVLCEDTMASTCKPEGHSLITEQRAAPHFKLMQKLGAGYLYWGDWKGVAGIETEDRAKCTVETQKPLIEDSKRARFARITEEQKQLILKIFLTDPLPDNAENATLFLPRDFVADGLLSEEEQTAIFAAVAKHFCTSGPLFVKTHPRDPFDYRTLFPDAVILQRTMPSEILNFCLPFRFARAVTVESTVLLGFEAADEKLHLTLKEARALV